MLGIFMSDLGLKQGTKFSVAHCRQSNFFQCNQHTAQQRQRSIVLKKSLCLFCLLVSLQQIGQGLPVRFYSAGCVIVIHREGCWMQPVAFAKVLCPLMRNGQGVSGNGRLGHTKTYGNLEKEDFMCTRSFESFTHWYLWHLKHCFALLTKFLDGGGHSRS